MSLSLSYKVTPLCYHSCITVCYVCMLTSCLILITSSNSQRFGHPFLFTWMRECVQIFSGAVYLPATCAVATLNKEVMSLLNKDTWSLCLPFHIYVAHTVSMKISMACTFVTPYCKVSSTYRSLSVEAVHR